MPKVPISTMDLDLLKKEIETVGDQISSLTIDQQAQVDRLRIEIEALRRTLTRLHPDFGKTYEACYQDALQAFDPEWRSQKAS